jgi:hypothetical protein
MKKIGEILVWWVMEGYVEFIRLVVKWRSKLEDTAPARTYYQHFY